MRSLALLLVLIAAFYVLLADQKPGKVSEKKATENKPSQTYFPEGLPDDYMPTDITRFGTMEKLKADLDYRRMRMDHQLDDEMKEFKETHEKSAKDKEAYKALIKKHHEVRAEFREKYVEKIKDYKKMKTQMHETNERGLR